MNKLVTTSIPVYEASAYFEKNFDLEYQSNGTTFVVYILYFIDQKISGNKIIKIRKGLINRYGGSTSNTNPIILAKKWWMHRSQRCVNSLWWHAAMN
jgi:hypothetical protein